MPLDMIHVHEHTHTHSTLLLARITKGGYPRQLVCSLQMNTDSG